MEDAASGLPSRERAGLDPYGITYLPPTGIATPLGRGALAFS